MNPRSGRSEAVPYSLSRWTDVPAAKWDWMRSSLQEGRMQAIDPRVGTPSWWSLDPAETHSLVFWTKNPKNLVVDYDLLRPYRVKAHITITGWEEEEIGAPSITYATSWASQLADLIGFENITWRFSPVPLGDPELMYSRFEQIAQRMATVTDHVYLAFLQTNDLIPETRKAEERIEVMKKLADIASIASHGFIDVRLCNDDKTLFGVPEATYPENLSTGVCVPCEGEKKPVAERCGCAIMVDPFTINETCTMGCRYCYAADRTLADKKRNTTRGLKVIV